MLSDEHEGSNIDSRFESLNCHFAMWCRTNKKSVHIPRVTKDTVQWASRSEYPQGNWFKGSVTTLFMNYLEDTLNSALFDDNPMIKKAGEAASAINSCFKAMYEAEAFIQPQQAEDIAERGLRFLRRYSWLAKQAQETSQSLFLLTPKARSLHHIMLDLLVPAKRGAAPLNPICYSCQMDEDFLGYAARLSRRCEPRRCSERVIQRHLQGCYAKFVKAKYIILD